MVYQPQLLFQRVSMDNDSQERDFEKYTILMNYDHRLMAIEAGGEADRKNISVEQ
jgi:hypothetical protein